MADIRHIGRDDLRQILADMDIEPVTGSDGSMFAVFPADEELPHDVVFCFVEDDCGWFGIEAFADGFDLTDSMVGNAMSFVNDFNRKARITKATVKNCRLKLEQWTMFPSVIDNEFVKEYIELVLTMGWRFFADAKKNIR